MLADSEKAVLAGLVDAWFDEVGPERWYNSTPEIDAMLRLRYGEFLEEQGAREAGEFLTDPNTALGAAILFDQVPRNIQRGTRQAYGWDEIARTLAREMLQLGWTQAMGPDRAQFALMPLMHSEILADQDASVRWFAELVPDALDFARKHREAIVRFGCFPHRNAVLGRQTSPEQQRAIDEGLSW